MTKREIVSMIIKLAGFVAVIKYIGQIPMAVGAIVLFLADKDNPGYAFMSSMYALGSLITPIVYVLLIVYCDKIAAKLFPEDKMIEISTPMSKDEIMSIAFTCIGLLVIASTIPELAKISTRYFVRTGGRESLLSPRQIEYTVAFIAAIVKLAIGCWCFLGAKGIVNLWHKIRGHVDSEEYRS